MRSRRDANVPSALLVSGQGSGDGVGKLSWLATLLRAGAVVSIASSAYGEETLPAPVVPDLHPINLASVEVSSRIRFNWTEMAFNNDRPKAWDAVTAPEQRLTLRIFAGDFEGKFEAILLGERFENFGRLDNDTLRGEASIGIKDGNWAYLVDWKPRYVYDEGFGEPFARLNTYAVRARNRFKAELFGVSDTLFQVLLSANYTDATTPQLATKAFVDAEMEVLQPLMGAWRVLMISRVELADFPEFGIEDRRDATFSLRVMPSYDFGQGLSVGVEGKATVSLSTYDNKTGESWEVIPILRIQKAL